MKFDSRITFPHPVLGIRNDILGEPDFDYEISEDENNHILDIKMDLHNPSIKYYIDVKRQAKYVCEVDCYRTYYRVCEDSIKPSFHINIPKKEVSGEVNVQLTVTAVGKIDGYTNSLANADYSGYEFNLEKGDILAYIGGLNIQTDIMADEYKAVGSFVHFKGDSVTDISYNLSGQDIEIIMPREMFDQYVNHLKGNRFRPVIISSIVKEAIVYALTQYKTYRSSRWARILKSAEVLKDYNFEEDEIDVLKAIGMSNDLLKNPHGQLFDTLEEIITETPDNSQ
jgi:hypothetical protein